MLPGKQNQASDLYQLRLRLDIISERVSRLEGRSLVPEPQVQDAKQQLVKVRDFLEQLDRNGGLGQQVHDRIRQLIAEIVV